MSFKLQSSKLRYLETKISIRDLAKFPSVKTTFHRYFGAIFDHVRHWFSSWPLNKVCCPWCELQLLFRSHNHANILSYCSTLVKLASWKWHSKVTQHLEAKLVRVMNTKVVQFTILDVSKVLLRPYNHFIHWSYMITSISIYKKNQHFMW